MYKTKELLETIAKHPDHELIFMYPEDGSDYFYTLGHVGKIYVDEYTTLDDRVWLRDKDGDELFDHIADQMADDHYPTTTLLSEEEIMILDHETEDVISALEWTKCICVYIAAG